MPTRGGGDSSSLHRRHGSQHGIYPRAALDYRKLWDGKVHVLAGLAHMPFWEAPERLNPLLARFFAEVG